MLVKLHLQMNNIDLDKFLFLYQSEYGTLNVSQKDGLAFLLCALEFDPKIIYLQHVAYILATVKHECAGTWQPIAEYGKGKGYKYGIPDKVTKQTYYGRGFVQLTWKWNYEAFAKICKVDLVNEPDLAMRQDIAYQIMSYGMRNGSFTGANLERFINAKRCDYVNARKIINGLDCAVKIAEYAKTLERLLRNSIYEELVSTCEGTT